MEVVHINTWDFGGGAEEFSLDLAKRQNSVLIVKSKNTHEKCVIPLPPHKSERTYTFLKKVLWKLGFRRAVRIAFGLREFGNFTFARLQSIEAFRKADIVHIHNIHGGYFDLWALKRIAKKKKIVWTLHDMSPFTGGEPYTFGGKKYEIGKADDIDLSLYPLNSPDLDSRSFIMRLKRYIYSRISSQIYFVSPSFSHKALFENSYVFREGLKSSMIYYGIDTSIFKPIDRPALDKNISILFFNSSSVFKLAEVAERVILSLEIYVNVLVVGNEFQSEKSNLKVKNYGMVRDRSQLADILKQAEVFIFPSKAESFGMFPIEAMACGCYILYNELDIFNEHLSLFGGGEICENETEFKHAIERINSDRKKHQIVAEQAAQAIINSFKRKEANDNYLQLYSQIIAKEG